MRRIIKAIPVILYPYIYMFCLAGYFIAYSHSTAQNNVAGKYIIAMLTVAVVCNLYAFAFSLTRIFSAINGRSSAKELAKLNMIIKLVQIPAYIIHFCLGIIGLFMSVWGIGVILWAIFIDLITILLSGIVSIGANISAKRENMIPSNQAVLFSVLGFVYCVDVVISIVLYFAVKRKTRNQS